MSNIITANIVAASSPISIEEAITSDPNNEAIIFSIKNHEVLEFSHSFDSGQFIDGPTKTSNASIKIEFLDTARIYDPRLIGTGEFKYVYFYYGVGDKEKDWTGPIAAVLDPSKITYGTFSDGKRTFILEFTAIFANFESIPSSIQIATQTNYKPIPLFKITANNNGGSISPIGNFHSNMERLIIEYIKTMTSSDSEVLVLFPDFSKMANSIIDRVSKAASVATPPDYPRNQWTSTQVASPFMILLQGFFGLTCIQIKSSAQVATLPKNQVDGDVIGADPGECGREALESAYLSSEGKILEIHGYFDKKNTTLLEGLKNFLSNKHIGNLYKNPGGLHFTVENNIPFIKELKKINKSNCKISGNKPVVIVGDKNLVYNFIYGFGGDSNQLSDEDKNIYTKEFIQSIQKKLTIDVTDTIFDDKNSKDQKIPIFKVGHGDPNVLDFKININPRLYWGMSQVWTGIASTQNMTRNSKVNTKNDLLKSALDFFSVIKAFQQLVIKNSFTLESTFATIISFIKIVNKIYLRKISPNDPWKNSLIFHVPWFKINDTTYASLPALFATYMQSNIYDGTIKTPPFFKFNSPMSLAQGCYFKYSDPVYTANEQPSKIAEAFTGKYFVKGFRHTISSNGAYSEFTIQKLIQTNEAPIFK